MSMNYLDRAQYNLIYLARSVSFHYRFKTEQLDGALQQLVHIVDQYEASRAYYPVIPALPPETTHMHPIALAQKAADHKQRLEPYCYGLCFKDPKRFIADTHIEFSPAYPFRVTRLFVWTVGKAQLTSFTINDEEQFKGGSSAMPAELFEPGMTLKEFLALCTPNIGIGTEACWVPGWKLKRIPYAANTLEMPTVHLGSRIRVKFEGKINGLFWIGESIVEETADPPPVAEQS